MNQENANNTLSSFTVRYFIRYFDNQSVENAGVAFVKRADERNKFFEKIKQLVM